MNELIRTYRCVFCDKEFTRKPWYDRHHCAQKKKFEEKNNIQTIRACQLFNHWQKRTGLLRKGKEKTLDQFQASPFYKTFKGLAEFTRTNYVVSAFKYVDWLVDTGVKEPKWMDIRNLDVYRRYLRNHETPQSQVDITARNLRVWSEANATPIQDFFTMAKPSTVMAMVKANQILPWVLLGYDVSVDKMISRMSDEWLVSLDEHINMSHWLDKIRTDGRSHDEVQRLCQMKLHDELT